MPLLFRNGLVLMYMKNVSLWLAALLFFIPVSVWAGQKTDNAFGFNELIADGVVIIIIAVFSLAGGFASMFIKTDADEFVTNPRFAKIFIGLFLGLAFGLTIYNYYGLSIYTILVPILIVSSLGSAILVFYMRWFSSPETSRKFREKLESKIGINHDK